MTTPSIADRLRRNATGIAATAVTGTWLAALLAGFGWWLPFMLFGYVVIVPVVAMLFDEEDEAESDGASDHAGGIAAADERDDVSDALQRLRTRYANGDLTDEQFERKLDRLLETETPEDAAEWLERNREVEREQN